MATREADLDLGGDAKTKADGKTNQLMIGGGVLVLVATKPAPTVTNKAKGQVAAHA